MKKTVSAILLVLYFAFSSGVVINLHYCMDRFDSARLGATKSETCTKCGMHVTDANGCCHDEVKIVKLQDDQQARNLQYQFAYVNVVSETPGLFTQEFLVKRTVTRFFNDNSPPLSKQDSYLQNCVFRI